MLAHVEGGGRRDNEGIVLGHEERGAVAKELGAESVESNTQAGKRTGRANGGESEFGDQYFMRIHVPAGLVAIDFPRSAAGY